MEKNDPKLRELRKTLPYHYYQEFKETFKKRFPKETIPSRQMTFLVLTGKSDSYKVMEVLLDMATKRNEVKRRLVETLETANA